MIDEWEIILRMLAGTLCGMALGLDRDLRGKQAGLRTLGLVGLGASVIAVSALGMTDWDGEPDARSRVVQGIIQGILPGIGFIGAGVVLRDHRTQEVYGLTTAAAVFLTAALGIAAGLGAWRAAVTGTVIGLLLLWGVAVIEKWIGMDKIADKNGGKPDTPKGG